MVHLGLFDASGVLRQKRLSAGAAARALAHGWSFIDAIQWWGPRDEMGRAGGSEHQAVVLDAGSGRPYPFEQRAALFLAEFEGPLAELSPRHQLQPHGRSGGGSGTRSRSRMGVRVHCSRR